MSRVTHYVKEFLQAFPHAINPLEHKLKLQITHTASAFHSCTVGFAPIMLQKGNLKEI